MDSTKFVSASKLKQYQLCPHRQHFEKYQESPAKAFGDAVHKGIASWINHWRRQGENNPGIFKAAYAEAAIAAKLTQDHASRAEECFRRVLERSAFLGIDPDAILSVESEDGDRTYFGKKMFEVEIIPDVWGLRGAMDLVLVTPDGILRIPDWKSGQSEEVDDLQGACYALAAARKYPGFPAYETGFFYLEKGTWSSSRWDSQGLVGALEAVDKLARAFLSDRTWAPKVNKYCSYCTLREKCPEFAKALTQAPDKGSWVPEATVENFPAIVERLEKVKAIRTIAESIEASLMTARKTVLQANGNRIEADGKVYIGKESAQSYTYDLAKIWAETESIIGRPPYEVAEFASGAFDDLVKSQGDRKTKSALKKIKENNRTLKATVYKVTPTIAKGPAEVEKTAEELDEAARITEAQGDQIEDAQVVPSTACGQAAPVPSDSPGSAETGLPPSENAARAEPESPPPHERMRYFVCHNQTCGAIEYSLKPVEKCRHCTAGGPITTVLDHERARRISAQIRKGDATV